MHPTRRLFATGLAAVPFAALAHAQTVAPVTIFEARNIVTMEPSLPSARFVAVAGDVVLGVAQRLADLEPWTRGRTVSIDRQFRDNILMPGLIDPHVHPMQSAVMLNLPFIAPDDWKLPSGFSAGVQTPAGYRARLSEALSKNPAAPFITWGHHELFHGKMDRALLDQIAPHRAVVVWQRSFHDVIANTVALRDWGLETQQAFDAAIKTTGGLVEHGDFERGVFSETALQAALAKLRSTILTPEKINAGMATMQRMMLQGGVTTVSDMGTGIFANFATEANLIRSAFERADNPSRVMLMPMATALAGEQDLDRWYAGIEDQYASRHVRVDKRVKLFADGAFFALNMRMNAPGYTDGHIGKWLTEPGELRRQMIRFWEAGFAFHIHVNGDEGLDAVLDGLDALPARRGQTVTLEHLGYSTEAQNRRIARMGLMVSAQPNYIRVLGDAYAKEGLGPDRAEVMNRLGSLERKGVPLGLHSDFNMAPIDPLYLAWIAANRLTVAGNLKSPPERVSLDKALRAITIEAAQVIGLDAMVGSIASGKKADFAILDRDPYEAGAAKLRDLKVSGVVFEGMVARV